MLNSRPCTSLLRTVTHPQLRDSKGRLIPTVVCDHISDQAKEEIARQKVSEEDQVLAIINADPTASLAPRWNGNCLAMNLTK